MGLNTVIKRISLDIMQVAIRPAEIYLLAAYNPGSLFTIVGGPVWIKGLFAHAITAENSGNTVAIAICGVNMQNAAVVADSLIGDIIMWPLGAAATQVIIPNLAIQPMPTLASEIIGQSGGQLAGIGSAGGDNIALTVGGNLVSQLVFYVLYYRLNPNSEIVVA